MTWPLEHALALLALTRDDQSMPDGAFAPSGTVSTFRAGRGALPDPKGSGRGCKPRPAPRRWSVETCSPAAVWEPGHVAGAARGEGMQCTSL